MGNFGLLEALGAVIVWGTCAVTPIVAVVWLFATRRRPSKGPTGPRTYARDTSKYS